MSMQAGTNPYGITVGPPITTTTTYTIKNTVTPISYPSMDSNIINLPPTNNLNRMTPTTPSNNSVNIPYNNSMNGMATMTPQDSSMNMSAACALNSITPMSQADVRYPNVSNYTAN